MLNKYFYNLNFLFRKINFRKLLLIFFLLNPFNAIINFSGELSTSKVEKEFEDLIWIHSDQNSKNNKLIWEDNKPFTNEDFVNAISANLTELDIKAFGKMVSINGYPYPEISNYVPNAYVEGQKIGSASLRLISKTRHCTVAGNFSPECSDGILDLDFNIFNRNNYSFNTKLSLRALENDCV